MVALCCHSKKINLAIIVQPSIWTAPVGIYSNGYLGVKGVKMNARRTRRGESTTLGSKTCPCHFFFSFFILWSYICLVCKQFYWVLVVPFYTSNLSHTWIYNMQYDPLFLILKIREITEIVYHTILNNVLYIEILVIV